MVLLPWLSWNVSFLMAFSLVEQKTPLPFPSDLDASMGTPANTPTHSPAP